MSSKHEQQVDNGVLQSVESTDGANGLRTSDSETNLEIRRVWRICRNFQDSGDSYYY